MKDYLLKCLKSWTLWFNSILSTIFALVVFTLPQLQASLPLLQGSVPQTWYAVLLLTSLVGNIALRFKTDRAIRDK